MRSLWMCKAIRRVEANLVVWDMPPKLAVGFRFIQNIFEKRLAYANSRLHMLGNIGVEIYRTCGANHKTPRAFVNVVA